MLVQRYTVRASGRMVEASVFGIRGLMTVFALTNDTQCVIAL